MIQKNYLIVIVSIIYIISACHVKQQHTLFSKLDHSATGIEFKNNLFDNNNFNILNYVYFYNGSGVAIGDINNDGLQDIFFTGNMVKNRLYLNKGNFEFENITEKSGVASMQGWCTGATMVDINGDGLTDIYICRSADAIPSRRKNLLFINNGDLTFTEKAEEYGLANDGYSTQSAFFDYDKDGDLDLFLINHSLQGYTTGAVENPNWRQKHNTAFECKLYKNDFNGTLKHAVYTDVSEQSGITSNVLSFGLGLAVSDFNNDGWPDVYVSNDFNEADYLFINNGNGTFTERLKDYFDEVSLYSMGSDAADYNNDGLVDLVTMDMLPEDNYAQKTHQGAENFDKFQQLFRQGFYNQYSRNMLQKNNGDGTFSEIGQLAGISNTDWSWAALFSDFDNDGYKDLLATTGYVKDYTDMDFVKYGVDLTLKQRKGEKIDAVKEYINKMPVNQLACPIFKNNGDNTFAKVNDEWGLTYKTLATGAAYADLDNDGKMDLIISNTNDYAAIYRNNGINRNNNYLKVSLLGDTKNNHGIGSKVKLYCNGKIFYQEQQPVRGYQSSVDQVLNFGLGVISSIDSALIIWPNDQYQVLKNIPVNQTLKADIKNATGKWIYRNENDEPYFVQTDKIINYIHKENEFNDFSVQSLLLNYMSRQGPCITKADINKDGLEDIFIGGAKGSSGKLFVQTKKNSFVAISQPDILKDSLSEDVAAVFFDANNDGYPDLYVGSGGYEFSANDPLLQDRLYINDKKGNFKKQVNSLPVLRNSTSCVSVADMDGDGDLDIFVGSRVIPGKYPESPESYILMNDGKGNFSDVTSDWLPDLKKIGMVTDAIWVDINRDNKSDLIVVGEWMPVKVYLNQDNKLADASARYIKFNSTGLWNKIFAKDFDGDGDMDFVLGNIGLNTQFKANDKEPLTLYYKDFDGNGSIDPVFCYYINGVSYPALSRDDLLDQLPMLKNKFSDYSSYAKATIKDIFTADQLKDAGVLKAVILSSIYLHNNEETGFEIVQLPPEAQYAPVYAIASSDINNDGKADIILAGNNEWTRIKFGRYRANHGVVLLGDEKGGFNYVSQSLSGLKVRADIRSLQFINDSLLFFGVNNGPVITYIKE
ncbi:MAG: VCBS repeat-containing protein [Bacteroidetes bacterium]|nr:VCBS repeat-containing protein [Bacteroidota bacterium]